MERCAYCNAEDTLLYASGIPICLKCVTLREAKTKKDRPPNVHAILVRDLEEATLQTESATAKFNAVTRDVPSFIPPPDGTQRIHNASRQLTESRNAMIKALHRLNDFLERGIVPEDLKPNC